MIRIFLEKAENMVGNHLNQCFRILIEGPPTEKFNFNKVLNNWKEGHRQNLEFLLLTS